MFFHLHLFEVCIEIGSVIIFEDFQMRISCSEGIFFILTYSTLYFFCGRALYVFELFGSIVIKFGWWISLNVRLLSYHLSIGVSIVFLVRFGIEGTHVRVRGRHSVYLLGVQCFIQFGWPEFLFSLLLFALLKFLLSLEFARVLIGRALKC